MNKRTVAFSGGIAALALALSACGSDSYEYQVSGVVEAAQVDYDCHGLSMEAAAFVVKPVPRRTAKTSKPATKRQGSGSGTSSGTVRKAPSNKGVKLTKKPDKPERVFKVPTVKYKTKRHGCKNEYELFVRNRDGLFEQDVRKVDYDKCLDRKREPFPRCTNG